MLERLEKRTADHPFAFLQREYFHLDFLKHLGGKSWRVGLRDLQADFDTSSISPGVTVTKNKLVGEKDEAARRLLLVSRRSAAS